MQKISEWCYDNLGNILGLLLVLGVAGLFTSIIIASNGWEKKQIAMYEALEAEGFSRGDVQSFIRVTDFQLEDLGRSRAARLQLKRFVDGEQMQVKKTKKRSTVMIVPISSGR